MSKLVFCAKPPEKVVYSQLVYFKNDASLKSLSLVCEFIVAQKLNH